MSTKPPRNLCLSTKPLSTLELASSRNPAQDSRPEWSRFSFSVGLFHPLQCAGLSRRSLSPSSPVPLKSRRRGENADNLARGAVDNVQNLWGALMRFSTGLTEITCHTFSTKAELLAHLQVEGHFSLFESSEQEKEFYSIVSQPAF